MAAHLWALAHAERDARAAEADVAKASESEPVGYAAGLLTWILAGGVAVAAKSAIDELPPWTLVFWRVLIAGLVLLPFVLGHRRAMVDFLRKRWLLALITGALGLAVTQGMMFFALKDTSAVNLGIIFAVSPIVTMILAHFILGEPLGLWQIVGSLVAFAGIVAIAVQGSLPVLLQLDFSSGDLLVLASAFTFAAYTVLLRWAKFDLPRLPLLVILLLCAALTSLPLFLAELWNGQHANLALKGYLALAYSAIPGGAVMYLFFNWSVDVLGASRAGGLLYSQMFFTAILAWLFLGEPIEWYHYLGGGLILLGVVFVTALKPKAPTPSKSA